jgi:glycosyltransferase involved in cell wall biosynthesis
MRFIIDDKLMPISTASHIVLLKDFPEERWTSMDFCAEMLHSHIQADFAASIQATIWCPPFRRHLQRLPILGRKHAAFNADRILNRFWVYPRALHRYQRNFDLFHICDHTYSQLALKLPSERTGIFCHDLDAFRCIIEPTADPRPRWFRALARRQLAGLQRAALVFHTTDEVRRQIEQYHLVEPSRLVKAPLGVAVEYTPDPAPDPISTAAEIHAPYLLHVGSCIPRKRIDVLLEVFAALRQTHPDLHLVKVGGTFSAEHYQQINRLGLATFIIHRHNLPRSDVAHLYRNAIATLITSDNEGFGIPLIEALACGSVAVVSDIPAMREVGGNAAVFVPVADVSMWVQSVLRAIHRDSSVPDRPARLAQAAKYSWSNHARVIMEAYQRLLS